MAGKKGIALITCNRESFFEQSLESIPFDKFDRVYVVDASDPESKYAGKYIGKGFKNVSCNKRVVVGIAKNKALQKMIADGCEHLFLMEDDVVIRNQDVAEKYIVTANTTGLWGTLSHNAHGNGNRDHEGNVVPKNDVSYDNGVSLDFFYNSVHPFAYIHSNIIKHVGMFDPFYTNAIEHLDHFKLQEVKGLGSYYWWFPSPSKCWEDIEDIDNNHESSIIRRDAEWKSNLQKGAEHFVKKYQYSPFNMPHATEEQVLKRLDYLEKHYSKKL